MKILTFSDYKENKWKGGITREIMILPIDSQLEKRDFDIRISSAVIENTESIFSNFEGYKRIILPLKGNITLITPTGKINLKATNPFTFDGSEKIYSTNSVGAIDFNIIFKPEIAITVEIMNNYTHTPSTKNLIVFALESIKINNESVKKYSTAFLNEAAKVEGKAIIIFY